MNTPVNGPRIENGSETTSVAIANPRIVFCSSGLNTIEDDERRLEQPVARLRDQPDREQPPEVVAPQGLAGALPGRLHAEDGRRTASVGG